MDRWRPGETSFKSIGNGKEGRSYGTSSRFDKEATSQLTPLYKNIFFSLMGLMGKECTVLLDPAMSPHNLLRHGLVQKFTQRYHIDINEVDLFTLDKGTVPGAGFGFSAFVGMSKSNQMVVFDEDTGHKVITFGKGSILILRYGCIHAGVQNLQNEITYKTFTAVGESIPVPDSQLWYIEKDFASSEWYKAEDKKETYVTGFYVNKSCLVNQQLAL